MAQGPRHVRHRALRVRCDRAPKLGLPTFALHFFLPAYVGALPNPDRREISNLAPPLGCFRKSWFCNMSLQIINNCAFWIHPIFYQITIVAFCVTFCSLFSFLAKPPYSVCLSKTLQNTKATLLKTIRVSIKIEPPGPNNPPPAIVFCHLCFIGNRWTTNNTQGNTTFWKSRFSDTHWKTTNHQ